MSNLKTTLQVAEELGVKTDAQIRWLAGEFVQWLSGTKSTEGRQQHLFTPSDVDLLRFVITSHRHKRMTYPQIKAEIEARGPRACIETEFGAQATAETLAKELALERTNHAVLLRNYHDAMDQIRAARAELKGRIQFSRLIQEATGRLVSKTDKAVARIDVNVENLNRELDALDAAYTAGMAALTEAKAKLNTFGGRISAVWGGQAVTNVTEAHTNLQQIEQRRQRIRQDLQDLWRQRNEIALGELEKLRELAERGGEEAEKPLIVVQEEEAAAAMQSEEEEH